jgi:hypothetical protein
LKTKTDVGILKKNKKEKMLAILCKAASVIAK